MCLLLYTIPIGILYISDYWLGMGGHSIYFRHNMCDHAYSGSNTCLHAFWVPGCGGGGGGGGGVGSRGCVGRDGKKAESLDRDPPQ